MAKNHSTTAKRKFLPAERIEPTPSPAMPEHIGYWQLSQVWERQLRQSVKSNPTHRNRPYEQKTVAITCHEIDQESR
jgi:hypothetical protein